MRPVGFIFGVHVKNKTDGKLSIFGVEDVFAVGFRPHPKGNCGSGGNCGIADGEVFTTDTTRVRRRTGGGPARTIWASVGIEGFSFVSTDVGSSFTGFAPGELV